MRKVLIYLLVTVSMLLFGCSKVESIESTDLNNIKLDDIVLGQPFDEVDLSKHKEDHTLDNKIYTYNFEEVRIAIDSNKNISKLWMNINNSKFLNINGKSEFNTIEDISSVLGENYREYWYYKDQRLKLHEYIDDISKIKANFVYYDLSDLPKNLVWVILESTRED